MYTGMPNLIEKGKLLINKNHIKSQLEGAFKLVTRCNKSKLTGQMNLTQFMEALEIVAGKMEDAEEIESEERLKYLIHKLAIHL